MANGKESVGKRFQPPLLIGYSGLSLIKKASSSNRRKIFRMLAQNRDLFRPVDKYSNVIDKRSYSNGLISWLAANR